MANNIPELRFSEFMEEWDVETLDQLTTRIGDGIHSTPKYNKNGDYFFINGNNLDNGSILITSSTKKVDELEAIKHKRELSNRTILLSINGTIGNLAFYDSEKVMLGKSAAYINLKDEVDKVFVYNTLKISKTQNFFTSELTGSTIKNLSLKTIRETKINIPTPTEQTKIATFLTAVDKRINLLQKKKAELEQYKKGVMQKIFNYECENDELRIRFKKDDGSDFPDWEEKMLGEVCDVRDGTHESPKYHKEGFPLLTSKNLLKNGRLSFDDVNYISKEDFISINKRSNVNIGDILFGMIGTIGNPVLVDRDDYAIKNVALIKEKIDLSNAYLIHYLNSEFISKQFYRQNTGGTQKFIALGVIRNLSINLPIKEEQQKIATFLSSIDESISTITNQVDDSVVFKKGLLQKMFV